MTFPVTGSLVKWRLAHNATVGLGLIVSFERKSTPLIPNIMGAWVHWPNRDEFMWSSLESLDFLMNTGSLA